MPIVAVVEFGPLCGQETGYLSGSGPIASVATPESGHLGYGVDLDKGVVLDGRKHGPPEPGSPEERVLAVMGEVRRYLFWLECQANLESPSPKNVLGTRGAAR